MDKQLTCPHCGHLERDAWEIDFGPGLDGDTVVTCGKCEQEYFASRQVSVWYQTTKITEKDAAMAREGSMNHTPEPWEHIGNGDIQGREDNGYGAGNVDVCSVYMRTVEGRSEANARRIVACVNACAGISTENLVQNRPIWDGLHRLNERIRLAEQHRDKLLAICEELSESAAYWSEYDVPIGIVDRLNAAIDEVKGNAA